MKREEAFKQYEETLAKIDKEARKAREEAKAILHDQLKTLQDIAHEELKAIRKLEQKTRR